jgi:uncharacterized protein (UPF0128 family)
LLKLVARIEGLKRIFIIHGEEEKAKEFMEDLKRRHYDVQLPTLEGTYDL